jgi:glyoxylase-like metal-dependent hydrolase (beta-lactamase superfamily II)
MIAMVVRPDNVAFVVDVVSAKRLFYRDFPGANVDHWTQQVKKVAALDFDILIGGHGPTGVKSDVDQGLVYLQELRAEVKKGLEAGKTVEQLKASVTMDKYKTWGSYASVTMDKYKTWGSYDSWRALNVEGMARHLKESGGLN